MQKFPDLHLRLNNRRRNLINCKRKMRRYALNNKTFDALKVARDDAAQQIGLLSACQRARARSRARVRRAGAFSPLADRQHRRSQPRLRTRATR